MRADARENRQAVIEAARELFGSKGAGVSLTAVADQAGIGVATLYRNFPTREDLVEAVAVDLTNRTLDILKSYRPQMDADPETAWPALVYELAALRPGTLIPALVQQFSAGGTPDYARELRDEVLRVQNDTVQCAKDAGVLAQNVTPTLLQLGIAAITRPLTENPGQDCPEYEQWLIQVYLRGLMPDAGTPSSQ